MWTSSDSGGAGGRRGRRAGWVLLGPAALAAAMALGSCGKDKDKKGSSSSGGYVDGILRAKMLAEATACKAQLKSLDVTLRMYAAANDGAFPPSLDKLVQMGMASSDLLKCPGPAGGTYRYVPGQTTAGSSDNILVYEAKAVHDGKANVLRVNGTIEALLPNQLQMALKQQGVGPAR